MAGKKRSDQQRWRTAVVAVTLTGGEYLRAHEACHAAARLWNAAVSWVREQWASGNHGVNVYDLKRHLSTLPAAERPLHAHTTQAVAFDLFEAIRTSRVNRRNGTPGVRAPWREKRYRPLSFTAGYGWRINRDGRLSLSMGRGRQPFTFSVPEVCDPATGDAVSPSRWGEVQLCWDGDARGWSLHIAVPASPAPQLDPYNVVAIDEGIINPVTLAAYATDSSYAQPIFDVTVVNGREMRAIKRERNKAVGQITRKLSRCTPGSRRHGKLVRARKRQNARCQKRLRDARHQVSKDVLDFAVDHDAGTITAGDVRGIEQNTLRKRRASRSTRQQLSQWDRGEVEQLSGFKTGVTVGHINEAYSSQTCPACLTRNRPRGRNYRCRRCAFECHRDAVGAINILMRILHGEYRRIDPNSIVQVTYLRAVPRWSAQQRARHGERARRIAQNSASENQQVSGVAEEYLRSSATSPHREASHQGAAA